MTRVLVLEVRLDRVRLVGALVLDELVERVVERLRVPVRAGDQVVEQRAERVDVGRARRRSSAPCARTLISLGSRYGRSSTRRFLRAVGVEDRVHLAAVEERERVVLRDVDVEVLEELDLGRALLHVDEELEDVRLLLRALEEQRARGRCLRSASSPKSRSASCSLATLKSARRTSSGRAAEVRIGQADEDVRRLDVAVADVAHEVRVLDRASRPGSCSRARGRSARACRARAGRPACALPREPFRRSSSDISSRSRITKSFSTLSRIDARDELRVCRSRPRRRASTMFGCPWTRSRSSFSIWKRRWSSSVTPAGGS